MLPLPTAAQARVRVPRLLVGLVLIGVGISLMVRADLGLGPWDVLHQGISERTGIPIGTVGILVGVVVLAAWVPLRERLGIGTIANVVVIGVVIDLTLLVLETPPSTALRWVFLVVGAFLFGPGSGFYIGVRLGPGPRDGLMTALAARGPSVRLVRTCIELTVLALGYALGGSVGVGTILVALTIGPNVQWFLERMDLDRAHAPEPSVTGAP